MFKLGQERRLGAIAPNPIPDLVPLNIDDEATIGAEGQDLAPDLEDSCEGPSGT